MEILIVLAVIICVAAVLLGQSGPYLKGKVGENFVSGRLLTLDPQQYKVLDNLMLPSSGNTSTTQIDHVVVSNFGVFCIETKSYKGWIFGDAQQQHWTQVIYRYKKRFYNPLRQNYAHIKAIEALLTPRFPHVPTRGFIAFPYADKLKISGTDAVGHAKDVVQKIKTFTKPVLSNADRDAIVQVILDANIKDKEARNLHDVNTHALKVSSGY